MQNDKVSGQIVDDPAKALPIGSQLHFQHKLFQFAPVDKCSRIDNWGHFDGTITAIHVKNGERQTILGTGVLVAPGIVLTAKHVLDDLGEAIQSGESGVLCSAITRNNQLQFWRPTTVTLVGTTDVAILTTSYNGELPPENIFNHAIISTRTPSIGEPISVVGFRFKEPQSNVADLTYSARGNLWVSSGSVTQVYLEKRDSFLINWPVIELNCNTLLGMSGGAAFDRFGFLIGIITSGFTTEDDSGPSYISMLWPALGTRFLPAWPQGAFKAHTSLLEMDRTLCAIEKPESVSVEIVENGPTAITYRSWMHSDKSS